MVLEPRMSINVILLRHIMTVPTGTDQIWGMTRDGTDMKNYVCNHLFVSSLLSYSNQKLATRNSLLSMAESRNPDLGSQTRRPSARPKPGGSEVVATSQVSRFHSETLSTLSNDVDLKGMNITIGNRSLLVDADLRLFNGTHYGLIGQNGVGKSTLLKCIGYKQLAGFPSNIRVLYVEQLEGQDMSRPVVQVVMDADLKMSRLRKELHVVQSALEADNPAIVAQAMRQIRLERLLEEKAAADKIALERSGSRGAEARKWLVKQEKLVEKTDTENASELTQDEIHRAPTEAQDLLAELFSVMELHGEETAESKARRILKGLGFPSNGTIDLWKSFLVDGVSAWHILLLDEPTNHLDLPAIIWLQDYLSELENTTIVTVSHDRAFLNAVAKEIIVFKDQTLTYHAGNFDEYLENSEEKQKYLEKMAEAIERKKGAAEKSVQVAMTRARQSGDDKKMAQMASRQRKLERMGMEVNEKAGFHNSTRSEVELDKAERAPTWSIPDPIPLRQAGAILEVEDVSIGYDRKRPILTDVTLNVGQSSRVAIVGANGAGKTTFMKLLVDEIAPIRGHISRHTSAKIGYFTQHHVDDLHQYPEDTSALSLLLEKDPQYREQDVRAHLVGEMVRVAFALNTLGSSPHLLVLDEPTNHLDFLTTQALIEALKSFGGAIVVVSHDQFFVSEVADDVYLVKKERMRRLHGGMQEYVRLCRKSVSR
ncbi:Protein GCN20 [Grifola frondosa]|uniref:Protein GCN20 n=1 Tax=Grifola frondosa TaxID=5627 RepID=A0A1C7MLJ3_GRIFR|nr:Protein GCN20 [Grifola frondosa]